MTVSLMMMTDAVLLGVIFLALLIRITEDRRLDWFERVTYLAVAYWSFCQAAWLLGMWVPGAAGYPVPRLALDGALAIVFGRRAVEVFIWRSREKRRLREARASHEGS